MPDQTQLTTIVFDWGDTLMVNDPAQNGPMVDWPKVAAVPGALEALAKLKAGGHRLILASNAQASHRAQIWPALERVGLAQHIDEIFTMHELGGARKPARSFFLGINAALECQPWQTLMVGDEYSTDVAGAATAGWKTAWFNPSGLPAPLLAPLYDIEVARLAQLPEKIASITFPGIEECKSWYIDQEANPNLMIHVEMVAALAYQMAFWLRQAGQAVDPLLAHRGGLLHDVCKLSAREGTVRHPEAGARLLEGKGQPVLAEIVRRHGLYSLLQTGSRPRTWEEKLVYYADKLVESNHVAPIEQRLTRIRERYGLNAHTIQRLTTLVKELGAEVCKPLGWSESELSERLAQAFLEGQ